MQSGFRENLCRKQIQSIAPAVLEVDRTKTREAVADHLSGSTGPPEVLTIPGGQR